MSYLEKSDHEISGAHCVVLYALQTQLCFLAACIYYDTVIHQMNTILTHCDLMIVTWRLPYFSALTQVMACTKPSHEPTPTYCCVLCLRQIVLLCCFRSPQSKDFVLFATLHNDCDGIDWWDQASVPLTIFRSNSKFDQNVQCSSLNILRHFALQDFFVIGRVHFKPEHCNFLLNFDVDRNIVSGTGARLCT